LVSPRPRAAPSCHGSRTHVVSLGPRGARRR
jgi:hypothetical protein